jgi:hypothetical protein
MEITGSRGIHLDKASQTSTLDSLLKHTMGRGRATDVAQTNHENPDWCILVAYQCVLLMS